MRMRVPLAVAASILVAVVAVLLDRVVLRGLGLDGAAPPLPAPQVVPLPMAPPPPPAPPPVQPLSEIRNHALRRCAEPLEHWRENPGSLAARTAASLCMKRFQRDLGPVPGPDGIDGTHQVLFENAVAQLRERDEAGACSMLQYIRDTSASDSPWRDKAIELQQRRCTSP